MPKKQTKAETVVESILGDISDRSGLGDAWGDIDEDTQKEIKTAWIKLVEAEYGEDEEDEDLLDDDDDDDDED